MGKYEQTVESLSHWHNALVKLKNVEYELAGYLYS